MNPSKLQNPTSSLVGVRQFFGTQNRRKKMATIGDIHDQLKDLKREVEENTENIKTLVNIIERMQEFIRA